jgi:hypothetical protein
MSGAAAGCGEGPAADRRIVALMPRRRSLRGEGGVVVGGGVRTAGGVATEESRSWASGRPALTCFCAANGSGRAATACRSSDPASSSPTRERSLASKIVLRAAAGRHAQGPHGRSPRRRLRFGRRVRRPFPREVPVRVEILRICRRRRARPRQPGEVPVDVATRRSRRWQSSPRRRVRIPRRRGAPLDRAQHRGRAKG